MSKFAQVIRRSPRFWWFLLNVWNVVVFAAIVFNFQANGSFDVPMDAMLVVYIALLTIYAGDKEFERWRHKYQGRHPGEVFVFLWTILMIGLGICQYLFHREAGLTSDIVAAYIAVLSILAVTRRSRVLYARRRSA